MRGDEVDTPEEANTLLQMNCNVNKSEVARQKIISHHFSGADAGVEVFASMSTKLLPQAIKWIGKDELGSSLMYQFLRGMPSLFELNTKPKVKSGAKRKHTECNAQRSGS